MIDYRRLKRHELLGKEEGVKCLYLRYQFSNKKIGGLDSGETIEPARQAEALLALKVMLRSWGALSMNVFATAKESCTLIAGTGSYTWGVGGTINSARPNQVIGAYILESGTSYPVDVITEGVYRSISVKATTGIPNSLFLHSAYPLVLCIYIQYLIWSRHFT